MIDQPNNDDWIENPAPASYRRVPTQEELAQSLANAPDAPEPKPKPNPKEGKKDGRKPEPGQGGRDRRGKGGDAPGHPSGASAGGEGGKGGRGRPRGEIYDNCPVTPLGVRGDFAWYLDALGQLRGVKEHKIQTILSLWGRLNPQLQHHFPSFNKSGDKVKNRFDQTHASMIMIQAAAECGLFDPQNGVRGVGCWTDDDGRLIYHAGDEVLQGGAWRAPGRIEERIYPAYPRAPRPAETEGPDPAPEILETLASWNWTAPDVHPQIALGMIATMMLCGALDWRPTFWLLAPAGAGKSDFQKLMAMLMGDGGLVQSTDATKSGITSKLGQSSLPVAIDEFEPGDERSTKERDMVQLARVASSGGEWMRGSADQTGVGGKIFSAFLFSSILIPGIMKTQDVQRLIRLEMRPLRTGTPPLVLQARTWRERGARLRARLFRRWSSWPERLSRWRHVLEQEEVTGRDADNWATVLAMADMAQEDEIAAEDVMRGWAKKAAFLAAADKSDTINDADAMLLHLMSQHHDPFRRGELHNIAQWVMAAAQRPGAVRAIYGAKDEFGHATQLDATTLRDRAEAANRVLAKVGLRVQGAGDEAQLFIANAQMQGLNDLFRGSQWHGGVWSQSARRVPGAELTPHPLTLAGIRSRGVLMPIRSIPGLMSFQTETPDTMPAPRTGDELEDFM